MTKRNGRQEQKARLATTSRVTERGRTEDALRENEVVLRATLEATADGILVVDNRSQVLYTNARFAEMWRVPKKLLETGDAEKLRRAVADQLEDPEAFLSRLGELYETPQETFDALSFRDGRVFERLSRPLMREGKVGGRVWSFRDVTEPKRVEEALRESEEKYRTLFELASDAFLTTLPSDGRIIDANLAAAALLGYSQDELIGLSGREHIIAPEVLEETEREWQTQLEQQGHFLVETVWVRKDSTRVPVAVSGRTLEVRGQLQFQLIGRDISERNRLEEALQRARETLEGEVEREMVQDNPYRLTFREFTVLHLLAAGRADKEIAGELVISPLTVHKHVQNILGKMNAASRTEAGVRALREGWLD